MNEEEKTYYNLEGIINSTNNELDYINGVILDSSEDLNEIMKLLEEYLYYGINNYDVFKNCKYIIYKVGVDYNYNILKEITVKDFYMMSNDNRKEVLQ